MLLEIVEANNSLVDAWFTLGKLYKRQGRMAEALSAFREAHDRRPLDPSLVSKLADALISTGQPAEAEQLLLAAQAKHPDNPYIVFALARVLETTGRFAESENLFRESLTLDPRLATAHVRLAALALRREDVNAVNVQLDAALRLDPGVPDANLIKGQLLESQNRIDEAAQAYRNELSSSPNSLPAAISLSRLEGRRGRTAEQERVLRNAIQANPQSPGPYLVLAMSFLQRGERYAEAVELAELALQQGPKGEELRITYLILANLYDRLGDANRSAEYARLAAQTAEAGEYNR